MNIKNMILRYLDYFDKPWNKNSTINVHTIFSSNYDVKIYNLKLINLCIIIMNNEIFISKTVFISVISLTIFS